MEKNNLTGTISLLHVQGEAIITTTLEASNCVSALSIGAHPRKGFALVDICKESEGQLLKWSTGEERLQHLYELIAIDNNRASMDRDSSLGWQRLQRWHREVSTMEEILHHHLSLAPVYLAVAYTDRWGQRSLCCRGRRQSCLSSSYVKRKVQGQKEKQNEHHCVSQLFINTASYMTFIVLDLRLVTKDMLKTQPMLRERRGCPVSTAGQRPACTYLCKMDAP